MKAKRIQLSFLVMMFVCVSATVQAQVDNLVNMSAKWVGANARNASLEGGDIVNYNPAGLALINDGWHISLSNQTLFRKPAHSFNMGFGEQSFEQDGPDYFLPSGYMAYKHKNWALSSGVFVTGGGASADYPEGSVNIYLMGFSNFSTPGYNNMSDLSLKASSFYLAVPLNFSYLLTDNLGVSIGGRYVSANNNTKAGLTLVDDIYGLPDYPLSVDYKTKATGFGGVFGIDYALNENINLSLHYETKVKLEFEAQDNKGIISIEPDGNKSDRDLPAVLYTGISYQVNEKLLVAIDFNYYFQTGADWDSITDPRTGVKKDASEIAGNSYAPALGIYYQLTPKLQLTAGCKYIHFDYSDQELYYTKLGLYEAVKYDNLNIGLGAAYNITDKIQANLGLGRTFWKDKTINSLSAGGLVVDITDKAYVVALGVDFNF
jgi:long-chain fatty acid transport protein